MAREERKKEDLFIKPKEQRRTRKLFITSSIKMDEKKGVSKTTISSSVFTKMSQSFANGDHLIDNNIRETQGAVMYMLQEMQADIDDVYNEVSASSFQASFFPFARIDSGSFGLISSSLVPGLDSKYDLGSSGKEWNNLYVDGTAYIDSLDLNGTNINTTLNAKALKTHISGAFTSLSASIATDINNAGGGTIDTTLKNGSTNAVQNNAVFDGLALKLNLSGGAMTGLIRPIVTAVTGAPKQNLLDASKTNVYEFAAGKAITIDAIIPAFTGQEITIMNIGTGAVTLTGTSSPNARSIYHAKGSNYTINQHQAYKLVCNQNQVWYVL